MRKLFPIIFFVSFINVVYAQDELRRDYSKPIEAPVDCFKAIQSLPAKYLSGPHPTNFSGDPKSPVIVTSAVMEKPIGVDETRSPNDIKIDYGFFVFTKVKDKWMRYFFKTPADGPENYKFTVDGKTYAAKKTDKGMLWDKADSGASDVLQLTGRVAMNEDAASYLVEEHYQYLSRNLKFPDAEYEDKDGRIDEDKQLERTLEIYKKDPALRKTVLDLFNECVEKNPSGPMLGWAKYGFPPLPEIRDMIKVLTAKQEALARERARIEASKALLSPIKCWESANALANHQSEGKKLFPIPKLPKPLIDNKEKPVLAVSNRDGVQLYSWDGPVASTHIYYYPREMGTQGGNWELKPPTGDAKYLSLRKEGDGFAIKVEKEKPRGEVAEVAGGLPLQPSAAGEALNERVVEALHDGFKEHLIGSTRTKIFNKDEANLVFEVAKSCLEATISVSSFYNHSFPKFFNLVALTEAKFPGSGEGTKLATDVRRLLDDYKARWKKMNPSTQLKTEKDSGKTEHD